MSLSKLFSPKISRNDIPMKSLQDITNPFYIAGLLRTTHERNLTDRELKIIYEYHS